MNTVDALSLITSVGCNLDCQYCVLDKTKKENLKYSDELFTNTSQAITDGTFLTNILTALKRFNSSPNNIFRIEFWGQEPTLILDKYTEVFPIWLKTFPSLHKLFFSTNGVAYQNKIIDFLNMLEKNVTHDIDFIVQWSYDGQIATDAIRANNKENNIYQNLINFVKEVDKIKLKKVHFQIFLHGVISFALINQLGNNIDNIYKYWNDIHTTEINLKELKDNLYHPQILSHIITFTYEVPYVCSTIDGLNLDYFMKATYYVEKQIQPMTSFFDNALMLASSWRKIIKNISSYFDLSLSPKDFIQLLSNQITNALNTKDFNVLTQMLSGGFFCGANKTELKIMYDGTLISCQNTMYINHQHNTNNLRYEMEDIWLKKNNNFLNVNTATDEELELYKYFYFTLRHSCFWHSFTLTLTHMYYLALAHEINPIYKKDLETLFTHALIVSYFNNCTYNNSVLTGSAFTSTSGTIKRVCNGLGFLLEKLSDLDGGHWQKDDNIVFKLPESRKLDFIDDH